MPIHSLANFFGDVATSTLLYGAIAVVVLYALKTWSAGRTCTLERDWAGKMILVVGPPTSTTLSLLHHLLHLPRPPQVLYLPPLPTPLPEPLLTILHTIRLGATSPLAQLHCEPLAPTPQGVSDFVRRWGEVPRGATGEGGRRIDGIVLASGWEVGTIPPISGISETSRASHGANGQGAAQKDQQPWTTPQFHFHLLTSLLPHLLRTPLERDTRIVALVPPTFSAALPTLQGKLVREPDGQVQVSARRGVTTLLVMRYFQLVLNALAAASVGKGAVPVPDPEELEKVARGKRVEGVRSNLSAISVVMPWTREEVVRGVIGPEAGWRWWLYMLFYPILMLLTPSPSRSIQSILFALSAPIRHSDLSPSRRGEDELEPRRSAVAGGDVVRDCAVVNVPPVLLDPDLARASYDALQKEVEGRVSAEAGKASKSP